MAEAINMPQVGQDIQTARILEWYVEVGQKVKVGDILATVESDKANFEVEAFESGTVIALLFEAGDEAEVFKPIAYIGEEGEDLPEAFTPTAEQTSQQSLVNHKAEEVLPGRHAGKRPFASPSARRLASEKGFELNNINGSGPGGRIIKGDVLASVSSPSKQARITPLARRMADEFGIPHHAVPGTGASGKVVKNDVLDLLVVRRSAILQPEPGDRVERFSKTREIIAQRLTLSKQTIPHYYLFMDVDMTSALEWRKGKNENSDQKISVNDLLIKACADALHAHPQMNAHVDEEKIVIKAQINLGVAVATADGLLVPVIPDADKFTLEEISRASSKIAEEARRGVINSVRQGTFTISNLGMHGIQRFLPIINPPECAILSAGSIEKKAVPDGRGVKFIDNMSLGLACDHRAVDGEKAALFLGSIKNRLEDFSKEQKR